MLVLSRKKNEAVVCTLPNGDEIVFTVLEGGSHRTRVGIEAPPSVQIRRGELPYEPRRVEDGAARQHVRRP